MSHCKKTLKVTWEISILPCFPQSILAVLCLPTTKLQYRVSEKDYTPIVSHHRAENKLFSALLWDTIGVKSFPDTLYCSLIVGRHNTANML